ncbi:MAG TPA: PAS domain S-box protein [Anaerolineae bacterium]|nr:PAS domain S-box protein [Anaerolineae bacterium]
METLRLVIIEDEEAHFSLMKRSIANNLPNVSVYHFPEAGACLEKLDEIMPDIIISDYLMPGMNGIEFLEALNRSNKQIPVIITTGQGDEDIAVQAMKLGAWDYLVKSADFFTLLPSVIKKVVREFKLKESLLKSERRFQDLAERTPNWIWEMDAQGRYTYSNPVVQYILGYRPDEVIGRHFYDFFFEKEREALRHNASQVMAKRRPFSAFENRLMHRDGYEVIMETSGVPFFDKTGNLSGYRGIDRDISERKRAEERVRSLSQQLMRTQEIERQRLSADLHDHLAQELSTLKISLDTLFDNRQEASVETRQVVSDLSKIVHGIIMNVREMAYGLRPVGLNHLGLIQTIAQYCEDFSTKNATKVDFFSAGVDESKLDIDTKIMLFRLVQEGLNNIKKHACADSAVIRLVKSFPDIILRMEDNGKGFDVKKQLADIFDEKQMGLRIMEERVGFLNGKIKIESRLMQGAKILIKIPCMEKEIE